MWKLIVTWLLVFAGSFHAEPVTVVSGHTLNVAGHYVFYNDSSENSAWTWLYVTPTGSQVYKLDGVTSSGNLKWKQLEGNGKHNFEYVNVASDGKSVTFGPKVSQCNGNSSLSGTVLNPTSQSGLPGVPVVITGNCGTVSTTTGNNGTFVFPGIPQGTYGVNINAPGYIGVTGTATVNNGTNNWGSVVAIPSSNSGTATQVSGKIQDAVTGQGVASATIIFHNGFNNPNGTVVKTIISDANGNYSSNIPAGYYTVEVRKSGYTTANSVSVSIYGTAMTYDFTISPELQASQWRIILQWGQNPHDLDSHLAKVRNGNIEYHVFFSHRNEFITTVSESATLDHDDTSSYGPETITLDNIDPNAIYKYYVHDYSNRSATNSSALAHSGATVVVYNGAHEVYRAHVPSQSGTVWKVFEIHNNTLIPCEGVCMFNQSNPGSSDFGTRSAFRDGAAYFVNGEDALFSEEK